MIYSKRAKDYIKWRDRILRKAKINRENQERRIAKYIKNVFDTTGWHSNNVRVDKDGNFVIAEGYEDEKAIKEMSGYMDSQEYISLSKEFNSNLDRIKKKFNKPKRSLPMWISQEKLERLIDERVGLKIDQIAGSLRPADMDKYYIKKEVVRLFSPNYQAIPQNNVLDMIMNHLGIRIEITQSKPSEIKLVKIPKEKKVKK